MGRVSIRSPNRGADPTAFLGDASRREGAFTSEAFVKGVVGNYFNDSGMSCVGLAPMPFTFLLMVPLLFFLLFIIFYLYDF